MRITDINSVFGIVRFKDDNREYVVVRRNGVEEFAGTNHAYTQDLLRRSIKLHREEFDVIVDVS